MKATVTKPFSHPRNGAEYPWDWTPGDNLDGDVARFAVERGFATEVVAPSAKKAAKANPVSKAKPESKPRKASKRK